MTSLVSSRPRAPRNRDLDAVSECDGERPAAAGRSGVRPALSGRWYDIKSRIAYRRSIGRALRNGPLFQPETEPPAPGHPVLLRNNHRNSGARQPGWIFVCTDRKFPKTVRLGIAEADESELRSIRANRRVSRDLRLRDGEVLRYSVFANDVHAALRSVEAFLIEFSVGDDRYRVHSAAAATTIETCGVQLRARRSNFEPINAEHDQATTGDGDSAGEHVDALQPRGSSDSASTPEPRGSSGQRRSRRGAQRQHLANVVSEVGHSIALASEALQDTTGMRQRLTAGLGIENQHRGLLRPDKSDQAGKNTAEAADRLSAADIVNMERWVMRREAIEYIKLKRVQLAKTTLIALVCGAGLGIGLYKLSDVVAQTMHIGLAIVAFALLAALLTMATFWLRYRKGLVVWRGILANCADATLPGIGGRRAH